MADIKKLPKWATPERRQVLLMLWEKFGNKCLFGHDVCPIPEHYVTIDDRLLLVPKAKKIPCQDRNGNPIKDNEGNQVYLTVYPTIKTIEKVASIQRPYNLIADDIIKNWIELDRIERKAQLVKELKAIHNLGEQSFPIRGQFSVVSKEIYGGNQPLFYAEGIGINALTFKPFVKVRLASSYMRFYIDLGDILKRVSKSKRRKAIRYGKPLPKSIDEQIALKISSAVRDYLAH